MKGRSNLLYPSERPVWRRPADASRQSVQFREQKTGFRITSQEQNAHLTPPGGPALSEELNAALVDASPHATLVAIAKTFGRRAVLASSLGLEDVVLIDLVSKLPKDERPRIITLDTGRLPAETYELFDRLEGKYGVAIEVYFPEAVSVEALVRKQGINGFYSSVEARHACCDVRKVHPLSRALQGAEAWITGLRRAQASTRGSVRKVEWDGARLKVNPLADFTLEDTWDYVRKNGVPYNALHDRGFPSIGCAPCTRAIEPGEDIRAGRWWWENPNHRECGIHTARAAAMRVSAKREIEASDPLLEKTTK